jgi:nucleotide-binding universal stress UspA family protein
VRKKMSKSVLVGIDLSRENKNVLDWALRVSEIFDLSLHIIHIVEKPFPSVHLENLALGEVIESLKRERRKEIEKITAGIKVDELTITTGIPAVEILRLAKSIDAQMIILGAYGEGGHKPIGTNAEKVVRKSTIPVMVIKSRRKPVFSRILTYVDLSDSSRRALELALSFKERIKSQVTALFVMENPYEAYIRAVNTSEKAEEILKSFEEAAMESFKRFLSSYRKKKFGILFEKGHPKEVIIDVCKTRKINILVMGSQGMEGIQSFLLGNLTEKILRRLPTTVIVVKPESFQFSLP